MSAALRVLVVDDSALMRKVISDILETDPGIEVVATARDGIEAVELVKTFHPDVVTLDVHMPRLDGLTALRHIMRDQPTPVIILTGLDDHKIAVEALQSGAVDIVIKPSGPISADLERVQDELIRKVKLAQLANLRTGFPPVSSITSLHPPPSTSSLTLRSRSTGTRGTWVVAIGASTGGPRAVEYVLRTLPADLPAALVVVQHMPSGFTRSFAERLDKICALTVREGTEGDLLHPGVAYIAPGGYHMHIQRGSVHDELGHITLDDGPPVHNVRPAVDVTMVDVAELFGSRALGVVLTGMGSDGALGLRRIKEEGGVTIAQDRETSVVYGMPRAALALGVVDLVLPLQEIPAMIVQVISGLWRHAS